MPGTGRVHRWSRVALRCTLAATLYGCRSTPAPAPAPSTQPAAPPRPIEPQYHRISTPLDFESDTDTLFITAAPNPPRLDTTHSRTGRAALLPKGTRRVTIKLSSLLSGRDFPGTWTLAGVHLYPTAPTSASLSISAGQSPLATRVLDLPAGHWTPALLDLGPLKGRPLPAGDLRLVVDFPQPLSADLWLDDALLADNAKTLVDPSEGLEGQGWTVRREGFHWLIDHPQRFRVTLPTEEVAGGWHLDESNRIRARFHSDGATKYLTIYYDGRSYWDAAYKPLSPIDTSPLYAPQHDHPATLSIPEDQGRLDRNTPGDANHDGYNESTGAYALVASSRHLEVSITPAPGQPLFRPVFELRNLPPGDVRATIEGALAPDVLRLPDGRVLLIAPGLIQRPTTLDVRVR